MLTSFQIKNTSSSTILISELGLSISAGQYATVEMTDIDVSSASGDLLGFINNNQAIINNGSDLSQALSLEFLNNTLFLNTQYAVINHTHTNSASIGGPYYTQTQLQTSGQAQVTWGNLTSVPSTFTPVTATSSTLGGVIVGSGINVSNGTISVTPYSLPTASTSTLGGVKIDGSSITISSGTISATPYTLPAATTSTLGGVIIGTGVGVSSGTISVTYAGSGSANSASHSDHTHSGVYEPVLGNPTTNGYILSSTTTGTRSWIAPYSYTLPAATSSTLGGVIVGSNISVSAGTISISAIPWSIVTSTPTTIAGYGITLTSTNVTTALGYTPVNSTLVGAVSGIATLDSSGKLTSSQIPSSLVGALNYQGTWNASTNTPTLASGTGTKGYYYKVNTAGTTTIDTISQWFVGDLIIFDGTVWDRVVGEATNVYSFNTRSGAVTLTSSDVTTALTYTPYNSTNPSGYITASTLPIATSSVLGGVKDGNSVVVDGTGVLEVNFAGTGSASSASHSDHTHTNTSGIGGPYELSLGNPGTSGYILSSTTAGVRSWIAPSAYTLPAATTSTLGGVIVGTGLSVSSGTISVTYSGTGSASSASHSDHTHTNTSGIGGPYEPDLGNPGTSGYILSSTNAGVRSWVAQSGASSMQSAYNGGSTVNVNVGDMLWEIGSSQKFNITDSTGSNAWFTVTGSTQSVRISGITINITSSGTGNGIQLYSHGYLTFDDQYVTTAIPFSETGVAGFSSYFSGNASSVMGAINYLASNTEADLGNPGTSGYILSSTSSGTRSWVAPYSLPTASTTTLGGVKVDGSTITISSGVISAASSYTLPTASTTTLGGVKVDGTSITISNGVISTGGSAIGSLDAAYGNGRSVSVDSGPIVLAASGCYAPLQLSPISYTPTCAIADGQMCYSGGNLYVYDTTRGHFLSVDSCQFAASYSGTNVQNRYLSVGSVSMSSSAGYVMPWNGTVIAMGGTSTSSNSQTLCVYKNGSQVAAVSWTNGTTAYSATVFTDFVAGDIMSLYISGSGYSCNNPICYFVVKRRM
jgi:hypothetical protein